jgi:DNA-binding NarL/FixJ family response regulator
MSYRKDVPHGNGSGGKLGTNVVVVEDQLALAKGMEGLLRGLGYDVVGTAHEPEVAYRMIGTRKPHVALVDLSLPRENGASLTRRLLEQDGELGVLLLYTGVGDRKLLTEALDCGARGFALKRGPLVELTDAIRTVADGGQYMDPRLQPIMLSKDTTEGLGLLSPREREILDLLARGLTGEKVGTRLAISPETVRTHVQNAMEKLEAHTRAHAIVIALREGEIAL